MDGPYFYTIFIDFNNLVLYPNLLLFPEFLIIDTEAPEDEKNKCIERLQTHKENTSLCITPVIKEDRNHWAIGVLLTYNSEYY